MIEIRLDGVPYEQDIRELFMAFYPGLDGDAVLTGKCTGTEYLFRLGGAEFSAPVTGSRFDDKCGIKRELYRVLAERKGHGLPWGTLTGIRPTKLILRELEKGIPAEEIRQRFREEFFIGEEKLRLCCETAQKEYRLLQNSGSGQGWSLYIGIPFCPSRCLYCSFTSYPIGLWKEKKDDYIKALCHEITETGRIMGDRRLQTVYMGGGTPTSLEAEELTEILECVKSACETAGVSEITVEAGRPDSITEEKLKALKTAGVTRISVNPQSMNQQTLDLIGRLHTVDMVREKFLLARECGFDNINTDIIIGLPGEGIRELEHTMDELEDLRPESVTVHSLALKRASRLNTENFEYVPQRFETVSAMIDTAGQRCRKLGLEPYYLYRQKNMTGNFENVGYAAPGTECLYNVLIMEEKQTIVGCGAGCSTKIALGEAGVKRIENVKDPDVYIDRIEQMIERKREIGYGAD